MQTNNSTPTERLLPVLVYIQTHLDEDLSLEILVRSASLSPFHFHRLFAATIGETVKQYTQCLRLEEDGNHLHQVKSALEDQLPSLANARATA